MESVNIKIHLYEGSYQFGSYDFNRDLVDAKSFAAEKIMDLYKYRNSGEKLWATFTIGDSDFDLFDERIVFKNGVWEKGYDAVTLEKGGEVIENITRFEVIDHSIDGEGRVFVKYDCRVELQFQDDNRTLKVFIAEKI